MENRKVKTVYIDNKIINIFRQRYNVYINDYDKMATRFYPYTEKRESALLKLLDNFGFYSGSKVYTVK